MAQTITLENLIENRVLNSKHNQNAVQWIYNSRDKFLQDGVPPAQEELNHYQLTFTQWLALSGPKISTFIPGGFGSSLAPALAINNMQELEEYGAKKGRKIVLLGGIHVSDSDTYRDFDTLFKDHPGLDPKCVSGSILAHTNRLHSDISCGGSGGYSPDLRDNVNGNFARMLEFLESYPNVVVIPFEAALGQKNKEAKTPMFMYNSHNNRQIEFRICEGVSAGYHDLSKLAQEGTMNYLQFNKMLYEMAKNRYLPIVIGCIDQRQGLTLMGDDSGNKDLLGRLVNEFGYKLGGEAARHTEGVGILLTDEDDPRITGLAYELSRNPMALGQEVSAETGSKMAAHSRQLMLNVPERAFVEGSPLENVGQELISQLKRLLSNVEDEVHRARITRSARYNPNSDNSTSLYVQIGSATYKIEQPAGLNIISGSSEAAKYLGESLETVIPISYLMPSKMHPGGYGLVNPNPTFTAYWPGSERKAVLPIDKIIKG